MRGHGAAARKVRLLVLLPTQTGVSVWDMHHPSSSTYEKRPVFLSLGRMRSVSASSCKNARDRQLDGRRAQRAARRSTRTKNTSERARAPAPGGPASRGRSRRRGKSRWAPTWSAPAACRCVHRTHTQPKHWDEHRRQPIYQTGARGGGEDEEQEDQTPLTCSRGCCGSYRRGTR